MLCRQHVSDEEFLVLWEMGAIHSTKIFNRSDREKWSTSKGGPVFSKLFRLDRTDPLSFGPKFPEILVGKWARSVEPKFQPVGSGKVVHLKRWTRFFETFAVGPNRSIEFWAEISGNFG